MPSDPSAKPDQRIATLVVTDRSGAVLGVTKPITVDLPWWQEVGPVVAAVPGVTVLRLLDAVHNRDGRAGGPVTYHAEADADAVGLSLRPLEDHENAAAWRAALEPHPLRHPWAIPGGPAADLAWVAEHLTVTGQPKQHRTWNLSAIWSFPTTDRRGQPTTAWLKCVPGFFAHEAVVLRKLGDLGQSAPRVIATDEHRLLMAELGGEDGYEATVPEQMEMIDTLVDLQLGVAGAVDGLLDGGVPDHRSVPLAADLTALVERVAADRAPLRRLIDELPDRLDQVAELGVPDTLVHGDPHAGNCRRGTRPPIWFDWGDSFVGNPLFDLAVPHRMAAPVVDRWVARWAEAVPGSDPERAADLLRPIATLRAAWVYQRFCDNIEPSERIYHHGDVALMLDTAEAQVAQSPLSGPDPRA